MTPKVCVLGGGRMGSALVGGLLRAGWADPSECVVVERLASAREAVTARYPDIEVTDKPVSAENLILAVKPADAAEACRSLADLSYRRVLSIVAGVPTARLESWFPAGTPILRAMPNTPALLGAAASAVAGGSHVSDADFEFAEGVLSAIGVVVRLPEALLDVATGLSGSGPAYVFFVAEALVAAGIAGGLDPEISRVLSVQTMRGAARMLAETGESAEALRAAVTSPGGTTEAAINLLEERSVREAFRDAVQVAAERSRELASD